MTNPFLNRLNTIYRGSRVLIPFFSDLNTFYKKIVGTIFNESINNLDARFLPKIFSGNNSGYWDSVDKVLVGGQSIEVEFKFYLTSLTDFPCVFYGGGRANAIKGFMIRIINTGKFQILTGNGTSISIIDFVNNISINTWYEGKVTWSGIAGANPVLILNEVTQTISSGSGTSKSWVGNSAIIELAHYTGSFGLFDTGSMLTYVNVISSSFTANWVFNGLLDFTYDLSTNNNHLTAVSITSSNVDYNINGSTRPNDVGYSIWRKTDNPDIQVQFDINGAAISLTAGVNIPAGYSHERDVPAGGDKHNIYKSLVDFDPDGNSINKVPFASSYFDTDGTAWWISGSGTFVWNALEYAEMQSTAVMFIYKSILTIGKQYRVSFKAKSSTYTGRMRVYSGSSIFSTDSNISNVWQEFEGVITAENVIIYIQLLATHVGTIDIDNIVVQEDLPNIIYDRQNPIRQTPTSRASEFYNSDNPFIYHIDEISDPRVYDTFFEPDYKNRVFGKVKLLGTEIIRLDELPNYATKKENADLLKVTNYCGITSIYTPSILFDGNTVAWYDAQLLSTITKDGSDLVAQWNDRLGSGHNLLQATSLDKPTWSVDGILFDGIRQLMQTAGFTLNQPVFHYIVCKQITWINNDYIFDGLTNDNGLVQLGASPTIVIFAGSVVANNGDLTLNTFSIIRILINGASSKIIVDNNTPTTGNSGADNAGGLTLGAFKNGSSGFGNIQVKEWIVRKISDSAPNEAAIYAYLKSKYNL